ncbi:MAG TPA: PD-(D/E)XK nuclease family protein [Chitinophaga sp.]|uniref:PD-(D/E)XK nuclease family protein n=1 Tax=Chitinophaga sp. TaxID=1869181 RepID=UPI002F957263
MEVKEINRLLTDFDALPKTVKQPTYLELCKYPRRRFEEICSRLLCFYLAPDKEHQLRELFLRSLLQLLAPDKKFYLQNDKIHVISEENADGKRLDILVYSSTFVIGIENKITAGLYNPLETYKKRIGLYGNDNIYRVVLSLRKLSAKDDLALIEANGFINFSYKDYFNQIKQNLPSFIEGCNQKYLHHLNDFFETLENMTDNTILNEDLSNYFYDNADRIDILISLYNQFNNKTKAQQKERIAELKEKIAELTKSNKWWAWEGWGLGFNEFNITKPQIGIESYFEATKGDPLGIFNVVITAWKLKDWSFYEERLLNDYPDCKLEKIDNRAFLHVAKIMNNDEEQILKSLKNHYDYLANLTSEFPVLQL